MLFILVYLYFNFNLLSEFLDAMLTAGFKSCLPEEYIMNEQLADGGVLIWTTGEKTGGISNFCCTYMRIGVLLSV